MFPINPQERTISQANYLEVDLATLNSDEISMVLKVASQNHKVLRIIIKNEKSVGTVDSDEYYGGNPVKIEALILPGDLYWPQFNFEKQSKVICKNVICRKLSVADMQRDKDTIDILTTDNSESGVGWIGSPGIGKSISTGFQLFALLQYFRQKNIAGKIFWRSPRGAYSVTFTGEEATDPSIDYLCGKESLESFEARVSNEFGVFDGRKIVVLELGEAETDPSFDDCQMLVTTSARDARDKVLKTAMKTAGFRRFLCQPWLKEELRIFFAIVNKLDPEGYQQAFGNASWEHRFNEVGGILRSLMDSDNFVETRQAIETETDKFYSESKRLSIYNLPSNCKYFIAPFIKPNSSTARLICENGDLNYCFRYLSKPARDAIYKITKTPEQLEFLERYGLHYQFHQAVVLYGGLLNPDDEVMNLPTLWKRNEWKLEGCVIFDGNIKSSTQEYIKEIPQAKREHKFDSQVLQQSVSTLNPECVYSSTLVSGLLYDYLLVDHVRKRIHFIQVTTQSPEQHAITLPTFSKVFDGLQLDAQENSQYDIVYTLARPEMRSVANSKQGKFDIYVKFRTVKEEIKLSLADLYKTSYKRKPRSEQYELKVKNKDVYTISQEIALCLENLRRIKRYGLIRFNCEK